MRHTKGPWEIHENCKRVVMGETHAVAIMNNDEDAILVATAPELLDALECLLAQAIDDSKAICEENNVCYVQTPAEAKALDAIKKARGE